jgi:hypothetical protein
MGLKTWICSCFSNRQNSNRKLMMLPCDCKWAWDSKFSPSGSWIILIYCLLIDSQLVTHCSAVKKTYWWILFCKIVQRNYLLLLSVYECNWADDVMISMLGQSPYFSAHTWSHVASFSFNGSEQFLILYTTGFCPSVGRFFSLPLSPDQLWGPPSLLCCGYWGIFLGAVG